MHAVCYCGRFGEGRTEFFLAPEDEDADNGGGTDSDGGNELDNLAGVGDVDAEGSGNHAEEHSRVGKETTDEEAGKDVIVFVI